MPTDLELSDTPVRQAGAAPALLQVAALTVEAAGRKLLRDLSFDLREGELHALIGANGAGKSTVAYALMGCAGYAPSAGRILFAGKNIATLPMHERARLGLALAWQEPARFEGLSVADFLALGARVQDPISMLEHLGMRPESYRSRALDKTLSGGERKRVELAGVLARRPRLAILDEPTAGIDLLTVADVLAMIDALRVRGSSVLLITHQEVVARHADRASQLCAGRIVCSGEPAAVIEHYKSRACERCDGARCGHV